MLAKAKAQAAEQGGKVAMIYLESPGNPTNALVDIEAVRDARDGALDPAATPIAIDNTFLGPLWQSPLRHGADIVVYSLTKYAGGHSDLVAGGVSGAKTWMDPVRALRNTMPARAMSESAARASPSWRAFVARPTRSAYPEPASRNAWPPNASS